MRALLMCIAIGAFGPDTAASCPQTSPRSCGNRVVSHSATTPEQDQSQRTEGVAGTDDGLSSPGPVDTVAQPLVLVLNRDRPSREPLRLFSAANATSLLQDLPLIRHTFQHRWDLDTTVESLPKKKGIGAPGWYTAWRHEPPKPVWFRPAGTQMHSNTTLAIHALTPAKDADSCPHCDELTACQHTESAAIRSITPAFLRVTEQESPSAEDKVAAGKTYERIRNQLAELIRQYPDTPAGRDAAELIEKAGLRVGPGEFEGLYPRDTFFSATAITQ